ncbi:26S proteasome regulatory subunit 4 homolog A [Tanacetum coccineum]
MVSQVEDPISVLTNVANSTSATFLRVAGSELIQKYDAHSGGEREIQRTMLELLNHLDGFDRRGDVKVILATNKIECLDPALIRPGRIDRKIEFPLPDIKTMRPYAVGKHKRFDFLADFVPEKVKSEDALKGVPTDQ